MRRLLFPIFAALALIASAPARAAEDTGTGAPPFKEGDVISFDQLESLRPFLPKEVWANRDFFFFEGMKLEIGPPFADYSPATVYRDATKKFAGQPKLGPDGSLENYVAGQPFAMDQIDCKGDPQAGLKTIWNFHYRWGPPSGLSSFFYSYWDRGEELPLYYEGTGGGVALSRRPEPGLLADPTRIEILRLVGGQTGPVCVCDIVDRFDLSQPTISHHLKVLREAGLLRSSKIGIWAFYELDPDAEALIDDAAALLGAARS